MKWLVCFLIVSFSSLNSIAKDDMNTKSDEWKNCIKKFMDQNVPMGDQGGGIEYMDFAVQHCLKGGAIIKKPSTQMKKL
jgi:hypothetical protein